MTELAVVFDIGNVLIRWDPESFYDSVIGSDRRRLLFDDVDLNAMNEAVDLGGDFKSLVMDLADAHPDWSDEIAMWHSRWLDMLGPALDHSVRLLRALRRNGVSVYALSNFGKETFKMAEANYPFLEEFDGLVISGREGVAKPAAEIYEKLEELAGMKGEALFFTDDRQDNIDAAAARGWRTHLFEGGKGLAAALVDLGLLDGAEAE